VNTIVMDKVLSMLKGDLHRFTWDGGWWSYEWCHEQGLVQFHIYVSEKDRDKLHLEGDTTASGSPILFKDWHLL
jgi:hypothetical protein